MVLVVPKNYIDGLDDFEPFLEDYGEIWTKNIKNSCFRNRSWYGLG